MFSISDLRILPTETLTRMAKETALKMWGDPYETHRLRGLSVAISMVLKEREKNS